MSDPFQHFQPLGRHHQYLLGLAAAFTVSVGDRNLLSLGFPRCRSSGPKLKDSGVDGEDWDETMH